LFLRSFLVEAFRIPSASMENTLLVGDFLFVNKAVYGGELEIPLIGLRFLHVPGYAEPQARWHRHLSDSVEDSTPNLDIVKRVIGAPGDTLQMIHDTVFPERPAARRALRLASRRRGVQPKTISTSSRWRAFAAAPFRGPQRRKLPPNTHDWGPIAVPSDSFTGLWATTGTNRTTAAYWGFLPRSHIVGRPLFIYMSVATSPFRIRWNRLFGLRDRRYLDMPRVRWPRCDTV
jgi:signal peptidase I